MVSYLQVLVRSLMRKQTFEVSIYRQMVSYLQVLVRSLMRKQTFEVSLLPSNGISSPSADEKFDGETNLWKFSLYLRYCPNTTEASFEIWTSETRGRLFTFF